MQIKIDKKSLRILAVSDSKKLNEDENTIVLEAPIGVSSDIVAEKKDNEIIIREKTEAEKAAEFILKKKNEAQKINSHAKQYIMDILIKQDWGDTYEESLSELQNTAIATETKILYFLKQKIPTLTLTQIRENIALYIAGQKTAQDITNELTQAGLTQVEIDQYFDLLASAVEVAKLINWIEQVWGYVEEIETQIENAITIEDLKNVMNNISFPNIEEV